MAYATGIANSAADLRIAIVNLATANGWTWDSANEMLHKTPIFGKLTVSGSQLRIQGALGYAAGTLTSPSTMTSCITETFTGYGNTPLTYPLTYHIFLHTAPDDIVVAVNYGAVWWQWLGFGNGLAVGGGTSTPLWQWGTGNAASSGNGVAIQANGSYDGGASTATSGAPFWLPGALGKIAASSIYTGGVDGAGINGWYPVETSNSGDVGTAGRVLTSSAAAGLLVTQPNTWNGEALLIRCLVMASRPSNFRSYVAELPHLRFTRNDNLSDGQIVAIGSDKWFVAPVYRKNTAGRNGTIGTGGENHSGTIAMAIRYDGP